MEGKSLARLIVEIPFTSTLTLGDDADCSLQEIIKHCRYLMKQSDAHLRMVSEEGLLDDDFDTGHPSFHSPLPEHLLLKPRRSSRNTVQRKRKRNELDSVGSNADVNRLFKFDGAPKKFYYVNLDKILRFILPIF
jgi:hypothetical protein